MPYGRRLDLKTISNALDRYEAGASSEEICARLGISVRTLYRWSARLGRGRPRLEERIRELEDENRQLRNRLQSCSGVPG